MITKRQEIFKSGTYYTVQVLFYCDWCKEETNALEWSIKIDPKLDSIYTCPICAVKHKIVKEDI